jgi:hypothetical protein
MPLTRVERLAAVETELKAVRSEVSEIREDVKTLLAAHNRQNGASKLAAALWAGLLTLGGAIGGAFAAKGHG